MGGVSARSGWPGADPADSSPDLNASNISRKFNLPPSYVLIHRVSTSGIGVLCQLECEGAFRAEVLKWMPGYTDEPDATGRLPLPVA